MGEPSGGSFRSDGMEPHLAGVVGSSSSTRPLLEPAPSSLCAVGAAVVAAAAAGGGATHDSAASAAAIVALHHEEEVTMASQEKVVVMVPTSQQTHPSPAEVAEGSGGRGLAPSGDSVGRLFITKNSRVEVSLAKEADVSSEEEDEEKEKKKENKEKEKKKKKKKKKKSSSWWPDPEKRWPIQGFY